MKLSKVAELGCCRGLKKNEPNIDRREASEAAETITKSRSWY